MCGTIGSEGDGLKMEDRRIIPTTMVHITCERCGNKQNGAIPGNFFPCIKCGSIMEVRRADFTLLDKVRDFFGYDIEVIGHSTGQINNFNPDDLVLSMFRKGV